jgi:hypothetical protein
MSNCVRMVLALCLALETHTFAEGLAHSLKSVAAMLRPGIRRKRHPQPSMPSAPERQQTSIR